MTTVLLILGIVLVGVAARFAALAVALPQIKLKEHLQEIADSGSWTAPADGETEEEPAGSQGWAGVAGRIGGWLISTAPGLAALHRGELTAAGFYDVTVETVHGFRAVAAGGLFVVGALIMAAVGPSFATVVVLGLATVAGWQLPVLAIHHRGTARLEELDKELPDLIDVLIATVEAGMALGASLVLVAGRFGSTLGDELRLTVRQQQLGISTSSALEDMLARCDTPAMRAFVRTVTRGESMGLSIAPILRELATDMRRRRRQAAQEKMHKAPVKILFPMMFLIMPAMIIVLLFPAAYSVLVGSSGF